MNFNFKTLCSSSVLCFAGNMFAMDYNPQDAHSTTRGPGPWTSVSRKEKNLSAEVLNPIVQPKNEEVRKQERKKLEEAVTCSDFKEIKSLIDQGMDINETVNGRYPPVLVVWSHIVWY